jgi:hypothetical protein
VGRRENVVDILDNICDSRCCYKHKFGWEIEELVVARPKGSEVKNGPRSVRVRSRPLDQVDEAKLALALSMMARRLLEERARELASREPSSDSAGREELS